MFPWETDYQRRPLRPLPVPSVEQLLRHLQKFYSDRNIVDDLDSVVDACPSVRDVAVVEAYAKTRRAAPGFAPGSYSKNNHHAISAETLEEVRQAGSIQTWCPQCEGYFIAVDGRRKYCSLTCSQAAKAVSARHARKRKKAATKPQVRGLRPATKPRRRVVPPVPENTATEDALNDASG